MANSYALPHDPTAMDWSGAWSDTPENSVEFRDRVVHVWTNAGNYLVALHVEAQTGVGSLADASSVITDDLEVTIP